MLKILACCVNGSGIGLMMKLSVKKAVSELEIQVEKLDHSRIDNSKEKACQYDVVFCPINFTDSFVQAEKQGVKVIGLKNVMSQKEIKENLIKVLHSEKQKIC